MNATFSSLGRKWRATHDNETNLGFQWTIIGCNFVTTAFYCFTLYLLWSSVQLLRRFIKSHSEQGSNEKTACLHIVMILSLFTSSIICNILLLIAHGKSYGKKDTSLADFDLVYLAKFIKNLGQFVSIQILLFMFWGYAFERKRSRKSKVKSERPLSKQEPIHSHTASTLNDSVFDSGKETSKSQEAGLLTMPSSHNNTQPAAH